MFLFATLKYLTKRPRAIGLFGNTSFGLPIGDEFENDYDEEDMPFRDLLIQRLPSHDVTRWGPCCGFFSHFCVRALHHRRWKPIL